MVVAGPRPALAAARGGDLAETGRPIRFRGEWLETPVLRGEPATGLSAEGPVVFELPEATFVVPPGWSARVEKTGTIAAEVQ
jgi:N-methylhydantoinase A/oxoprolinase/acetone carboxylase beta subunit